MTPRYILLKRRNVRSLHLGSRFPAPDAFRLYNPILDLDLLPSMLEIIYLTCTINQVANLQIKPSILFLTIYRLLGQVTDLIGSTSDDSTFFPDYF